MAQGGGSSGDIGTSDGGSDTRTCGGGGKGMIGARGGGGSRSPSPIFLEQSLENGVHSFLSSNDG